MKLAICIPTYQNPDYIVELFEEELSTYKKLGICVYIMDSSQDEITQDVVKRYQEDYNNLFYYRFSHDIHSNVKVYKIFQMVKTEISCDYIWMRSDAVRTDEMLLKGILIYLVHGYDIVVLNSFSRFTSKFSYVTSAPQEVFDYCSWALTLYGAAILRVESMVQSADWHMLESKYLCDDCINFSHLAFYFEQIRNLKNFSCLILNVPTSIFYQTIKKMKKRAFWYNETIKIWLYRWPNVIERLPASYKNKMSVIKSATYVRFFPENLKNMAMDNVLDIDVYFRYKERISKYTDVPNIYFYWAAKRIEYNSFGREIYDKDEEYLNLYNFAKKYEKIVVYGCGIKAIKYAKYLLASNFILDCFCVTDAKNADSKKVMGYKVFPFGKVSLDKNTGIVLGMHAVYQMQVYSLLMERGVQEQVFTYPDSFDYMQNVMDELKAITSKNGSET
ncbi:MAG: glycosyltransferase family 2 protein [Selenomonas ruminantium]|nr:glycosyltransferase family 2 protein [Selenomonas ruminantium]